MGPYSQANNSLSMMLNLLVSIVSHLLKILCEVQRQLHWFDVFRDTYELSQLNILISLVYCLFSTSDMFLWRLQVSRQPPLRGEGALEAGPERSGEGGGAN